MRSGLATTSRQAFAPSSTRTESRCVKSAAYECGVSQVDDERALPGHERTQIPDEELWELNLVALDGSCYEVESRLLVAAPA